MTEMAAGRFTLEPVRYDTPAAAGLIEALQQEYEVRYGGRDRTPVDPEEFAPPDGVFLVGALDGLPVAAGGFRRNGPDAEIKRMYVAPAARGRGLSRRLLAGLEEHAAAAGYARMILETGDRQPEAIALYESAGYLRIPNFGIHAAYDGCRCFAKHLPPG